MSQPGIPKNFSPTPFDYHEEIEVRIDSLTNLGQGVGRYGDDNWVIFVPFAIPGELVKARIYRNMPTFSESDLVEVLEPSPHRLEPKCSLFGDCGGCQYQHIDYELQLEWKTKHVQEVLEKLAGVEAEISPVISSPVQYGYRSKITPHFQKPKDGKMGPVGFLRMGRRQQILDVPQCPIASDSINARLPALRAEVQANARSYRKGATLLLRDSTEKPGHVCVDPKDVAEEMVGDVKFEFHAGEFFQNNPHILPSFVDYVSSEAAGQGITHLVDAYCGSGLFSLTSAKRFNRVIGIEISEPAIDWAQRNARLNDIENAEFIQGDAANIFENVSEFNPSKTSVVIDPPRKGSTPEFLKQLVEFAPKRVVYVSCNPATQARDLVELRERYKIISVQPFDLFPQTRHLECVITLERR